jgi:hypothetical protein
VSIWQNPPNPIDFNFQSWGGRSSCAVCGSPSRGERVFRPPAADDFEGFFDICTGCMTEAADEMGMVAPGDVNLSEYVTIADFTQAQAELLMSRDACMTLTRENVRLQDVIESLEEPVDYVFSYDHKDDDDDDEDE